MGDSPAERLSEFRASLEMEQREFAATLRVSPSTISMMESGKRSVSKGLADKLFSVFGVSRDWLFQGVGEMIPPRQTFEGRASTVAPPDYARPMHGDVQIDGVEFTRIKRFDVTASAGPGAFVESERVVDQVAFTASWLLRAGVTADFAALVEVKGESMAPLLHNGSLALVDRSVRSVESGHVYVFLLADELFIKRLVLIEDGLLVLSDNPALKPYKIVGSDARRVEIKGRVRAAITTV